MFKTAKNTIKKAAKDQVEFFLVLLTGVFTGSIFTLAYVKYDVKTTLSFADIGGMLAGVGTIGLLYAAAVAAGTWKKQLQMQQRKDVVEKYFEIYHRLFTHLNKIAIERDLKNNKKGLKLERENDFTQNLMTLNTLRNEFRVTLILLETLLNKEIEQGSKILYITELLKELKTFDPILCDNELLKSDELTPSLIKELNEFIGGSHI
tara:strand:+ start:6511 stop:7128 length:618 start_codon:yes stop_codon:yes gene_type:complete